MKFKTFATVLLILLALPSFGKDLTDAQKAIAANYLKKTEAKGKIVDLFFAAPEKEVQGRIGFVILYTHEDPQGVGGNAYVQILAVFSTPKDGSKLLLTYRVGGKAMRQVSLRKVLPGTIEFDAVFYRDSDAACCPSAKGSISYNFDGRRLEDAGEEIFDRQ